MNTWNRSAGQCTCNGNDNGNDNDNDSDNDDDNSIVV